MAQAQEKDSKELVVIENLNAKDVFTGKNGVSGLIAKVKAQAVPKLPADTEEGREERRSLAYSIAKTKNAVDAMGKDYVGELKKVTTAIDAERRVWRQEMEAYQEDVRRPLTEYENAEKARIEKHQQAIQWMRESVNFDYITDSAGIEERLEKLKEVGQRDFEEFTDQAKTVFENSTGRLGEMLAAAIKSEQEAAELERLRKEKAEREEADRLAKIKEDAKAEAKAELEAQREKDFEQAQESPPAQESLLPPTKAEHNRAMMADSTPPAQTAPQAGETVKEHRRKINQAAVTALVDECMLSDDAAKAVITAIIKGEVPNVTINY